MVLERIEKVNAKVITIVAIIIVSYATIFPIAIPLAITNRTKHFYDTIAAIPDGSKILINDESPPASYRTLDSYPNAIACYFQLIRKNCKLYFYSSQMTDNSQQLTLMEADSGDLPFKAFDYIYGKDWVEFGWIAGMESGLAEFAKDIVGARAYDYQGTPLNDMPVMAGIKSVSDFYLMVHVVSGPADTEGMFRQIQAPYKVKILIICATGMQPQMMQYISSGQAIEMIGSTLSGAEYETLIGRPSIALATMGSITVVALYTILFVAIANIPIVARLARKRGGAGTQ